MSDPIVHLVQDELKWFQEVREQQRAIFPEKDNLYPIPFFGDIRCAKVLTLALNPAHTEFCKERNWLPNKYPPEETAPWLTERLLDYFNLPIPLPSQHRWFDECEQALRDLDCSYKKNAAHVDLHSLPTKFKNKLGDRETAQVANIIREQSPAKLKTILSHAPHVKLIIVIDYAVPSADCDPMQTFAYIFKHISLPRISCCGEWVNPSHLSRWPTR